MRKFTNVQKEHFRHLVLDCIIQRLTTQESLQYVKDKLGSEIGADHFNHVSAEPKWEVKKNLANLQKDRFAFVREFFDRIDEVRYIQKRLWRIIEDNPDNSILQKSCLSELHQSTLTLCNLYDALPAAEAVRPDFVNGGYYNGKHDKTFHFNSNQTIEWHNYYIDYWLWSLAV